ncbi:MAG: tetratricopeptide repeat protein [Deltaproteobacteria bacterium]|nr:tetratricopeptide repeat protein [Deltaproteobacteria bacterium]
MSSTAQRSAAAFALLAGVLGCTATAVDPSAQARDPNQLWEDQMARATRSHSQGRLESAAELYEAALATSEAFPAGDPRTLQTLSQRAELRLSQGLYEAAERDYRAVIEAERASSRGDGDRLANALNNLAVFYLDLGRIPEAEALLVEAIDIRVALYGGEHPYVAALLQNLGDAERRAGNFPVAEDLLIRSLTIYSRAGRDYWRNAAIAQNNLALLQAETGRVHDAERNHLYAIRLSIKVLGERNADMGVFTRDLATLYTHQARFGEAEDLYRESLSILREGLGESSHQMSKTYRAYSEMLIAAGRGEEAAEQRRRADATGF